MPLRDRLLDLVLEKNARTVFIVGTGKNAGKTVVARALAEAASRRGFRVGLASTGRDGEAIDVTGEHRKPRLFLPPHTVIATARPLLPAHPACELLEITPWETAAGSVVLARVRRPAHFEVSGPSTAGGVAHMLERFAAFGCDFTIVDGALDRIAALSAGAQAVVVAAGASAARAMEAAVDEAGALVRRLSIARADLTASYVRVDGALTPALSAQLLSENEKRQVIVRDATRVAMSGKAALALAERLDVRCEHPLHVVAAAVASIAPDRYFEPRSFAQAVARATNLPVFDLYAATETRAA